MTAIADDDQFLWLRLSEVQALMHSGMFNNEQQQRGPQC
ncbi:hypothetical protein [Caballeronia terrestris]